MHLMKQDYHTLYVYINFVLVSFFMYMYMYLYFHHYEHNVRYGKNNRYILEE